VFRGFLEVTFERENLERGEIFEVVESQGSADVLGIWCEGVPKGCGNAFQFPTRYVTIMLP
jgi:hypothetical protein